MRRRDAIAAVLASAAALGGGSVSAQVAAPTPAQPVGELKALGQDRYQVGRIVVDKRARSFSVPGRVLALGKPLEYLATSPGGMKAYETLFELDTTGSEFNLACILIGLERDPRHVEARRAAPGPLIGPRVGIFVAWSEGGKQRKVTAAEAMLNDDSGIAAQSVEWVYTGAPAPEIQGRFPTDVTGTLVGFKRDANNVIESAVPLGVGAYGSIRGHSMLPPVGSPIELVVQAIAAAR